MLKGTLIAESLRVGAALSGLRLQITRIRRAEVASAAAGQPREWTVLDFEASEDTADRLATALAACLSTRGAWYVAFRSASEAFVVFAGRVFRYPRGDARGRSEAQAHGRSAGIPEAQLDWPD